MQVPGELLEQLKAHFPKEGTGLLCNETPDGEEVLFCEHPRRSKIIFSSNFLLKALCVFMIPLAFLLGLYTWVPHKILFPLFAVAEVLCCMFIYLWFSSAWYSYQVITDFRVAEVMCHNNFILSPSVRCSYFAKTLPLLRDQKLFFSFEPKLSSKHFAEIFKNKSDSRGKATIYGDGASYAFDVSDAELLENALMQVVKTETLNWPNKPYSMKAPATEPTISGYVLGFLGLLASGGCATAAYFLYNVHSIPLTIDAVFATAYIFTSSIAVIIEQHEQREAIFNNSAFYIGDFSQTVLP
eukprot:Phypoly_transcript_14054.p1 GENE.Phypoly_transcript_14054~~Phypoly_transcript_14054.p1  ORF type:complete len:298 (+),score=21.70 Phypoly_transcript_14054:80-973(+)